MNVTTKYYNNFINKQTKSFIFRVLPKIEVYYEGDVNDIWGEYTYITLGWLFWEVEWYIDLKKKKL